MIRKLIENLNPYAGGSASISAMIVGSIPTFRQDTIDSVVFLFQIASFSISIIVGVMTLIHLYCKIKDRNKK